MNLAPVLRLVASAHLAIAVVMLLPALLASGDGRAPVGYIAGQVSASLIATLCWAASLGMREGPQARSGLRELLLSLIIFWSVLPLTAAIPFWVEGLSALDGWLESVSAITTTGGWQSGPLARASEHGMVYRASLQWLGGLVSLATAAAVFVRQEFIGISPRVLPFSRGEEGSYLVGFFNAFRAFLPIYAVVSVLGFLGFLFVAVDEAPALTMALSLPATGGFVPSPGGIQDYGAGAMVIAFVLMLVGGVSFVVIAALALGRSRQIRVDRDWESVTFLGLVPVIALIFWFSLTSSDWRQLVAQMFNAVSILSTNGIVLGDQPALIPALVTALVGGAAVSTAGGIKLLRWIITLRRVGEELIKLTNPRGVFGYAPAGNEMGVWIHSLAFAIIIAILVLTTAFFGFSFETSVSAAIAVVSNSGPLLDLAPRTTADFRIFDGALGFLFGLGMIAGRLELIIVLVMVNRRFWQG